MDEALLVFGITICMLLQVCLFFEMMRMCRELRLSRSDFRNAVVRAALKEVDRVLDNDRL